MKMFNKLMLGHREEEYNLTLMRGLSFEHLKHTRVLSEIDRQWRDWVPKLPNEVVYLGTQLATPLEHAANRGITRRDDLRIPLDESDIYTVRMRFGYRPPGESGAVKELPSKYMQIPYLREGGHSRLDGSDNFFAPLIVAKGFNVTKESTIFCWINKLNPNLDKVTHTFMVNNIFYNGCLFTCRLYQHSKPTYTSKQRKDERRIDFNIQTPILLYLLVRDGLKETMKKYFDADVITSDAPMEELVEKYPSDEWAIVSSAGEPIRGKAYFVKPTLKVILPREQLTHHVQYALAALYYVVDLFGDELNSETVEDLETWKYIIGDIALNYAEGKAYLINQIDNHLSNSIDILFDSITEREFRLDGFDFTCIEDFFVYVIKEGLVILNSQPPHSLNNKRLTVLRYTLRSLTSAINRVGYSLSKEREGGRVLNEKKIQNHLSVLKTNLLISGRNSFSKINGEVNPIQTASDNMYFKVTSQMIPQDKNDKSTNNKNGQKGAIDRVSNRAHSSVMAVGRAFSMPGRAPTGREEYNPAAKMTENGELYLDDYSQSLVDECQEILDLKDGGSLANLDFDPEEYQVTLESESSDDFEGELVEDDE